MTKGTWARNRAMLVWNIMRDGRWRTLTDICNAIGDDQRVVINSVSMLVRAGELERDTVKGLSVYRYRHG